MTIKILHAGAKLQQVKNYQIRHPLDKMSQPIDGGFNFAFCNCTKILTQLIFKKANPSLIASPSLINDNWLIKRSPDYKLRQAELFAEQAKTFLNPEIAVFMAASEAMPIKPFHNNHL